MVWNLKNIWYVWLLHTNCTSEPIHTTLGAQLFYFCFIKTNSVILKGKTTSSIIGNRPAYLCRFMTKISLFTSFICIYPVRKEFTIGNPEVSFWYFQVYLFFSLCFRYTFPLPILFGLCSPDYCSYSMTKWLNCFWKSFLLLHLYIYMKLLYLLAE